MATHATLRLPKPTHQALKAIAAKKGMTMTKLIEFYVKDQEAQDKSFTDLSGRTLGDYHRQYLPCERCGYRIGRLGKNSEARCWKCGNIHITRDFSDSALKDKGGDS